MVEPMVFPSFEVKANVGFAIPHFVKGWQTPTMSTDKVTEFSGERLKALRLRHKLTQQRLADSIDYARPTIGVWEQGHDFPGRDALLLLSQFFRVPITHFLPGVEGSRAPKGGNVVDDPDELALLDLWRGLTRDQRILMLRMVGGGHLANGGVAHAKRRKRSNPESHNTAATS